MSHWILKIKLTPMKLMFISQLYTTCVQNNKKKICLDVCMEMALQPITFILLQELFWLIDFLGRTRYDT